MSFPVPLWMVGAGVLLLGLAGWVLYERYLHPAWRKQRRVIRACEKAFNEEDYQLERLRTSPDDPSGMDLLPSLPFGPSEPPRYFTYSVETVEDVEPDFSGMSRSEVRLVRRYLHRGTDVPHHGREVLRPEGKEGSSFRGRPGGGE